MIRKALLALVLLVLSTVEVGAQNMYSIGIVEITNSKTKVVADTTHNFKVYNTKSKIITRDMMRAVSVDQNNIIWAGTDNGIVRIENDSLKLFDHRNSPLRRKFGETNIMYSDVDSKNNKWFTDGYNTYRYNDTNWTIYDSLNSPLSWVTGIYADSYGAVWFASFHGLIKFDGGTWSVMDTSNSVLPANRIMGVFVDSKHRLWIGTQGGNIRIDGDSVERFANPSCPLHGSIMTKGYEDTLGNIWFALYEKYPQTQGFACYTNKGNWTVLTTANSQIPRNDVLDFVFDEKSGLFWFSINNVGICSYDGTNWTVNTPKNSDVPSSYTQCMTIDQRGNIWCATFNGLLKISLK